MKRLAPEKNKDAILKPMGNIKNNIIVNKYERRKYKNSPIFVPSGQSTQLIVGATKESDLNILNLTENLYNKFDLRKVYGFKADELLNEKNPIIIVLFYL